MSEISRNFPASAPVAPRRRRQVKKAGLPSRGTMVALQIALLVAAFATWFVLVKVNILKFCVFIEIQQVAAINRERGFSYERAIQEFFGNVIR